MNDIEAIYKDFKENVNMSQAALKKYLNTDESKSVGIKKNTSIDKKTSSQGVESTGHDSGRKIVAILKKKKSQLDDDDYAHMKKVNGYIKRHIAQKPLRENIEDSRWRYSLMNWGHDPLKG